MLKDKNIVLGVTGGIAAYKAVEIASRLRQAGALVHVVMTREATAFVTELTFREITGNPVAVDMWGKVNEWNVEHIALANLADLMLIAPATANIISKIAVGIADDMLTTTVLATKAPLFIAPAMNSNMYENPIIQMNIENLKKRGSHIIPPASGRLACGTVGLGRLPEPSEIVSEVTDYFLQCQSLCGKKILVTAAGTIEPIDPVRYIGNRSSGKMGYAVAEEAARRGGDVVLVSGPSVLRTSPSIRMIKIETAAEMRKAVLAEFADSDMVIKAAAVADYRASEIAVNKIKKNDQIFTLVLEKNPDILKELGARKRPGQVLVGFAAETQNLLLYAKEKLEKKNLDLIVANDVSNVNAGFNVDTNVVKIIFRDGMVEDFPLLSKKNLAKIILDKAERCWK
jgi:phosphopantothenoylcysteine decarboxylase / phosphopantothenate---cysteine ligase